MGTFTSFDELTRLVSNTLDAFTAALFLREEGSDRFQLVSYFSIGNQVNSEFGFAEGEGYWGWVVKHGQPLHISPFTPDYKQLDIYHRKEEVKSFLAVPLEDGSGVLSVDSKSTYVFTDRAIKTLTDFARMALNLRLLKERLDAADGDQQIFRSLIGVQEQLASGGTFEQALERVRIFFDATHAFWTVLTEDYQEYYVRCGAGEFKKHAFLEGAFPIKKGLVGWVYRHGQPLLRERIQIDSRRSYLFDAHEPPFRALAFAGFPAKLGDRVFGVLGLAFGGERSWSRDEISTLGLVTALFATAI